MSAALALMLPMLVASPAVVPPDSFMFAVLVGGSAPAGYSIDAGERVEPFDGDPERAHLLPRPHIAPPGSYARTLAQVARYRAFADDPCTATRKDIIAFRLSWREQGRVHSVTFADSCRGIPTDLIDTMRPLSEIFEPGSRTEPTPQP